MESWETKTLRKVNWVLVGNFVQEPGSQVGFRAKRISRASALAACSQATFDLQEVSTK